MRVVLGLRRQRPRPAEVAPIPRDDLVPQVEIVRDEAQEDEHRIGERRVPPRHGEQRSERDDREIEREQQPVVRDPVVKSIGRVADVEAVPDQGVEPHEPGECGERPRDAPGGDVGALLAQPDEEPRAQHPRRKEVEHRRQLREEPIVVVGAAAFHHQAPRHGDDRHRERDGIGRAHERPHEQREDQVELHFDRERPQDAVDRARRVRPPVVDEEQVDGDLAHGVAQRVEARVADRDQHRDAQHVRRHDLDEAPVREVPERRGRPALEPRAHVWIDDHEPAQEKEQVDADEAQFRDALPAQVVAEHRDASRQPRDLPNVEVQDERDGQTAQAVEDVQAGRVGRRRGGGLRHTGRFLVGRVP